jgi:hypothetical protein
MIFALSLGTMSRSRFQTWGPTVDTRVSVRCSFRVVLLEIWITGLKSLGKRLKDPCWLARIMDKALKGIYPIAVA